MTRSATATSSRPLMRALGGKLVLGMILADIRNSEFIDLMIQDPVFADMLAGGDDDTAVSAHSHDHAHDHHEHAHSHSQGHSHSHDAAEHSHSHSDSDGEPAAPSPANPKPKASHTARDNQQDKVRSTLRSFVRDWTKEGASEREACYKPLLEALEAHFPDVSTRGEKKVLVPGCGLGRLAMEIAARGFWAQGNEFSTYMLIASHFALNQTTTAEEHILFPYLHSWSNHQSTGNHLLRSVRVPDVVPADILAGITPGNFSLVAGDFEEIYGPTHWFTPQSSGSESDDEEAGRVNQRGRWSAVVTCFFIDTARSVLNYMRIIHGLLEDGGVWINVGELGMGSAWVMDESGQLWGVVPLDEVKELAGLVGFDIKVS
ncbi:hypothetical protein A1Q2_02953 [Trichosporon asahii var. asahii CBS 8904]|uniref:carnosine N-methyltransferase n=1 Tax=Trichosporon asahii var. asahii (strain CBS 8904) TaxID=1220162 RepID=K1W159_TRIAC|nr:hypothetical protein A1Q2_02953 [Trichosporon asahii var. asahii CBS 8904]